MTFTNMGDSKAYVMWVYDAWADGRDNIAWDIGSRKKTGPARIGFNFAWIMSCWNQNGPVKCEKLDEEVEENPTAVVVAAWTIQSIYAKDSSLKQYAKTGINLDKMEDSAYPRKIAVCDGTVLGVDLLCKNAWRAGKDAGREDYQIKNNPTPYKKAEMIEHMKDYGVFGYTWAFEVVDSKTKSPNCAGGPCDALQQYPENKKGICPKLPNSMNCDESIAYFAFVKKQRMSCAGIEQSGYSCNGCECGEPDIKHLPKNKKKAVVESSVASPEHQNEAKVASPERPYKTASLLAICVATSAAFFYFFTNSKTAEFETQLLEEL